MSQEKERISVPTNGKGPHPAAAPAIDEDIPAPATVTFTPTQLAVGFGILASLIVLAVGTIRRRNRSGRSGRR